jgi:hypothetical protein
MSTTEGATPAETCCRSAIGEQQRVADSAQGREVGVRPDMLVALAEQVFGDRSVASQLD